MTFPIRDFAFALLTATSLMPVSALAQDYGLSAPVQIESETLGAAQDFDAGIIPNSALDSNLWQGTSAGRAAQLLSSAPLRSQDPLVRDMVRTVVLTGGVPPKGKSQFETEAYESARLKAALAIESKTSGDGSALDGFLARNPDLARAPIAQVDLALSRGNWQRACEISDTITTERALPEWARLRAACHALRGEMSAADVTRDLLRSSGYQNAAYHAQMDALLTGQGPAAETDAADSLVNFLANRDNVTLAGEAPSAQPAETQIAPENEASTGPQAELAAIFENFSNTDLAELQSRLGNLSFDITAGDLDLETALSSPSPRATARLFVLGQSGDARALDTFITRATRAGVSEDQVLLKLAPLIEGLPAQNRVNVNLLRYTQAAILSQDITSLQQIYSALPAGPEQSRIALIADALGGGFYGQPLGRDIEGRLTTPADQDQAVIDTQIALALGANLSDSAANILLDLDLPSLTLPQSQLILLDASIIERSNAETSLITASLLSRQNLNISDKAYLISALTRSGLQTFAGRLAADIYFDGLKPSP